VVPSKTLKLFINQGFNVAFFRELRPGHLLHKCFAIYMSMLSRELIS